MSIDTILTEKTITAELTEKIEHAPGIKSFFFRTEEELHYEPGQYAFYSFMASGKKYRKHFTVSNSPTREGIELSTVISRTNFKAALNGLEPGDQVQIRGGYGDFTLGNMRQEKVCFIQEGIGITPVRSMLQYAVDTGMEFPAAVFYSDGESGLKIFGDELEVASRLLPDMTLVRTRFADGGLPGSRYADLIKLNCPDYEERHFYISGSSAFTRAAKAMLTIDLDMEDYFISIENFTGY